MGNQYGNGRAKSKPFEIIDGAQKLYAEILKYSANAPKEYKWSICRDIWELSKNLIFMARLANHMELGSQERVDKQRECIEIMLKLVDLLPVFTKCRCITTGQEANFSKSLDSYRFSFRKWMESDKRRLSDSGKEDICRQLGGMMDMIFVTRK